MGYLFGQKRRKVGRLQRQAARCFLVTQEASSVELGTWCWPRVVLIEKRPLTESERSSMNRAARSFGARRIRRLGRNNWIWRLSDDVADRAAQRVGAASSACRGPRTVAAPGRTPGASGYARGYRQARRAAFLF